MGLESDFSDVWEPFQNTPRNEKVFSFNQLKPSLTIPKGNCNYRLQLTDWDQMPPSQQLMVGILKNLLEKNTNFHTNSPRYSTHQ